jgi:hypothetical protein
VDADTVQRAAGANGSASRVVYAGRGWNRPGCPAGDQRRKGMKRQMLILITLGAMFGLSVAPAQGQAAVRVSVPFGFVVADRAFPEGQYMVSSTKNKVMVRNAQGKTIAVVLSNAVSDRSIPETGQVVFRCYDQLCFLSEVWIPTQYAGSQLLESRWEKTVAMKKAAKYLALP